MGRTGRKGYTVVEILIVVVIAGFVALIGIPSFARYYQQTRLDTAARTLAMEMNKARLLAGMGCNRQVVRFHPAVGTYQTEVDVNDNGRLDPGEPRGPLRRLPDGVRFDASGVWGPPGKPSAPPKQPVTFPGARMSVGPDGRWANPGTVYLGNEAGDRVAISVTFAGRVRVWWWNPQRRRWQ